MPCTLLPQRWRGARLKGMKTHPARLLSAPFRQNSMITPPSGDGDIKLSCFSAVVPVKGWNQCVK